MQIGKLCLCLLLLVSQYLFAATPKEVIKELDAKLLVLREQKEINNLYGEIKFSNLALILNTKLILSDSVKIRTYFYWVNQGKTEKFDIEVQGDVSEEVKEHIKSALISKLKILVGQKIQDYLSNDELTFERDLIKALDISGDESNEKFINYKNNKLQIVEKKPSGTITTDYLFKKNPKGLLVETIEQKAYEGIQATESLSRISYKDYMKIPLPVKIETKLLQKLFRTSGDDLEVTREIAEIIEFVNIELNSDKALLWFSRN